MDIRFFFIVVNDLVMAHLTVVYYMFEVFTVAGQDQFNVGPPL